MPFVRSKILCVNLRLVNYFIFLHLKKKNLIQMKTYRTVDETTMQNNQSTAATSSAQVVDSWLFCVAEFEDEVEAADTSTELASIEEEFTTYITSLPKRAALDTFTFWEVC
jgi:hypothetical protein